MSTALTRRGFLHRSGLTAAGTAGLATALSAAPVKAAPHTQVRLGLIGCGGRGRAVLQHMLDAGVVCVAVADPDDHQSAEAVKKVTAAGQTRRPDVHRDFRKVLDRHDIDAVLVATPDHWHAICAIRACMSGKDVYLEKPISHNIREGRAIVRAARKHKRIVQVGTQQRSAEHFLQAKAFVDSGQLGRICLCRAWRSIHKKDLGFPPDEAPPPYVDYDLWLGPAPKRPFNRNRFHYQWRWFWDYANGKQADWGIHLLDVVQWYMNADAPLSVASSGGRWILQENTETPDTQLTIFEYPKFTCVWEHRMGNAQRIHGLDHGVALYGENGTLAIDRRGWQVYPEGKRISNPPRETYDNQGDRMSANHVRTFLSSVKTRKTPNADIEIGHRSTSTCLLGTVAFRTGRKIRWDAQQETVVGDAAANAFLTRVYRKPWTLPAV